MNILNKVNKIIESPNKDLFINMNRIVKVNKGYVKDVGYAINFWTETIKVESFYFKSEEKRNQHFEELKELLSENEGA